MKKKKIIITGAAGEVGLNLLNLINRNKYDIIAIDKDKANLNLAKKLFNNITIVNEDLIQKKFWTSYFNDADIVIQLHAQISAPTKQPYIDNNNISIKNVVEECEKNKIKHLIHISSSVVISVANDNYTNTKKEGEIIVHKSKVPHTILRPTLMYGCFDIKHFGFLIKLFDKFPIFPVPGSGKYIRQPLFVEDFSNIIIKNISMKPKNKIYNISGKEKIYFINALKRFAKVKGKPVLFFSIPIPIFTFLLKVYSFIFSKIPYIPEQLTAMTAGDIFPVIKWEEIFNIKPTSFNKGIKKMFNSPYYKYSNVMMKNKELNN